MLTERTIPMLSTLRKHAFEWLTGIFFLIAASIAVRLYAAKFNGPLSPDGNSWGTFGDYFGGVVGTLVSIAAFVMLVRTIYLQREMISIAEGQIALAREQLDTSQTELTLTRREMEQSTRVLRQQAFETAFFSLIRRVREAKDANPYGAGQPIADNLASNCRSFYGTANPYASMPEPFENVLEKVRRLFGEMRNWTEPYFRLIYHTLKWIHYSKLPEEERMRYASIFRSQFTDSELVILFFDLSIHRDSDLTHYVNFYGFLKHLEDARKPNAHWPLTAGIQESAFWNYKERKAQGVVEHENIRLGTDISAFFS